MSYSDDHYSSIPATTVEPTHDVIHVDELSPSSIRANNTTTAAHNRVSVYTILNIRVILV